ncbi:hypothetical protein EMCRGX_G018935 [Ephydatia muelleri]
MQARQFACISTLAGQSAILPTSVGSLAVVVSTLPRLGHALHQWHHELQHTQTTLQPVNLHHSMTSELTPPMTSELTPLYDTACNFEHKSCLHPDKASVTWLLDGIGNAPSLFNNYANALHWIMASNYGAQLLHYLDDFLLVGPPSKDTCQETMYRMLLVSDQLGIPVASEMLEGPTTTLIFLGTWAYCSTYQYSSLPPDKLVELTELTSLKPYKSPTILRVVHWATLVAWDYTLVQPPNHDQHLGLGHRPTQWSL